MVYAESDRVVVEGKRAVDAVFAAAVVALRAAAVDGAAFDSHRYSDAWCKVEAENIHTPTVAHSHKWCACSVRYSHLQDCNLVIHLDSPNCSAADGPHAAATFVAHSHEHFLHVVIEKKKKD